MKTAKRNIVISAAMVLIILFFLMPSTTLALEDKPYEIYGYVFNSTGASVGGVTVTITDISITEGINSITSKTGYDGLYKADIGTDIRASEDGDTFVCSATYMDESGLTSFVLDLTVPPDYYNITLHPDTTPPEWVTTVGIQSAEDTGKGGEVIVTYGTATDVDTPPVKYNVYYSTSSPATSGTKLSNVGPSPYTVTGLTNGQLYYFTVRVEDSAISQNEDTNTVELSATPTAPTAPPGGRGGGGGPPREPEMNVPVDPETGAVLETTMLTVDGATLTFPKGTIIKDAGGNPLATSIFMLYAPTIAESVGAIAVYDFGPAGLTFVPPIDLVIPYDPADIPAGMSESDLVVRMWDGTAWIDFVTSIDTVAHVATAKVSHFTIFGLFATAPVAPPPVTPTPTIMPTATPEVTPTPTPTPPIPPIRMAIVIVVVVVAIVAAAIIVAVAFVPWMRRRKKS